MCYVLTIYYESPESGNILEPAQIFTFNTLPKAVQELFHRLSCFNDFLALYPGKQFDAIGEGTDGLNLQSEYRSDGSLARLSYGVSRYRTGIFDSQGCLTGYKWAHGKKPTSNYITAAFIESLDDARGFAKDLFLEGNVEAAIRILNLV